jgi:DNA processing protein
MRDLTDERRARIVLSHLTEPCDATAGRLVRELGPVETVDLVWRIAIPGDSDVGQFVKRASPRFRDGMFDDIVRRCEQAGIDILTPEDEEWPVAQLSGLGDQAPHVLYVKGNASLSYESLYSVAIVGARAASAYGEHVAMDLASDLAKDHVVVSGAAYGIDGVAHRGALAAGGKTIAVLAGGVDRPYPAGHSELISRVAASGAIVSEVPPGSAPTKWRFLARNRLIAALGTASIVVEAGWRSGSLNEAGHARQLGRPVGAVPGPVTSAASTGCHRLIREGAFCITSATDVRELTGATA